MRVEDYYESERDRMLVEHWRAVWQRERGACNVDARHQCFLDAVEIVRPYVCAPHFYGCLQCGQGHLCYRDPHRCLAVAAEDGATLTCQYSGQVLCAQAQPSFVGTHSEKLIADDNAKYSLQQYVGDEERHQSRGLYKPRRPMLYTNSRVHLEPARRTKRDPLAGHREKAHPVLGGGDAATPRKRKREPDETDEETGDAPQQAVDDDALEVEQALLADFSDEEPTLELSGAVVAAGERDDDEYDALGLGCYSARDPPCPEELYWDTYYAFLDDAVSVSEAPSDDDDECMAVETLTVVPAPPRWHTTRATMLEAATEHLLGRLLELQLDTASAATSVTERRALVRRLTGYFVPRVHAVSALLERAPVPLLPPDQLCAALLLRLFGEAFVDEDQCGNRVEIWHACAWLAHLHQCGVLALLYGERTAPAPRGAEEDDVRRRPVKKKRKTPVGTLTRKRVKQSAAHVQQALTVYKGQPHWLRHFIQDGDAKLNEAGPLDAAALPTAVEVVGYG